MTAAPGRTADVPWVPFLLLVALASACDPVVEQRDPPDHLVFDTEADPARIPSPNNLLLNRDTGRIDFEIVDEVLPAHPADCVEEPGRSVAQCEFDVYLESLDGYPTLTPVAAPSNTALNLNTVRWGDAFATDSLVVIDATRLEDVADLEVSFDATADELQINRPGGWDLGRNYVVAIRGYDHGVVSARGRRVVAPWIYHFARQNESLLTCTPDPPDPAELDDPVADPECKYARFLAEELDDPSEVVDTLAAMETLRQGLIEDGVWTTVADVTGWVREELALAWAFRVHSASVAELDPNQGLEPVVVDERTLRVAVKGSIDASSLTASSLNVPPFLAATVLLLDLTALDEEDYANGFPAFTVSYEPTGPTAGSVVLKTQAPLVPGSRYGILLTTSDGKPGSRAALTNAQGTPLVPAPITVLLRSHGPILDIDGHSLVDSVSDEDAVDLEDGRQEIRPLLDNAFFMDLAELTRENIAYVYAVEIE